MPITQDRFLTVISESEAASAHHEEFVKQLRMTIKHHQGGFLDVPLDIAILGLIDFDRPPQIVNTRVERMHFTRNAKGNEARRQYNHNARQRDKGVADGILAPTKRTHTSRAKPIDYSLPPDEPYFTLEQLKAIEEAAKQTSEGTESKSSPTSQPPSPNFSNPELPPDLYSPPDFKKGIF